MKWKGTERFFMKPSKPMKNLCFKESRFMGIKMCVDDILFILTAPPVHFCIVF